MKKLLLSLSILALGVSAAAAKDYVLFGNGAEAPIWSGDSDGYTTTVTVDGQKFTITTAKAESTSNLAEPGDQIRVYKSSSFTITAESLDMKQIVLGSQGGNYGGEQTISEGWEQKYDSSAKNLTLTSAGLKTMQMNATANQYRVTSIVVSDEVSTTPDPVTPTYTTVNSVAETIALTDGTDITVNYPLTVAFVNNQNIFACDDKGDFIQIYNANSYAINDVIPAGWTGTYKLYSGVTPEITDATLPASTEQKTFVPKTVAAADIDNSYVNRVVLVQNVVFSEATPDSKSNFTGKVGDATYSFRNNYSLESVPAGTYDVTIVVTIYNNAPSLYVINYAQAGSGVNAVATEAAEAEYFNLQGVRVANPEKGLYIRVEGGKASKVIL